MIKIIKKTIPIVLISIISINALVTVFATNKDIIDNEETQEEQVLDENELSTLEVVNPTEDRLWNFSDPMFDVLQQYSNLITENFETSNGLTLKASNDAFMELMPTNKNIYGNLYTRYLNLEGEATGDARKVEVEIYGDADIYILARGSNVNDSTERYLNVEKENLAGTLKRRHIEKNSLGIVTGYGSLFNSTVAQLDTQENPELLMYEYRGNGDKIILYSQDSGINIFSIAVKSRVNPNQNEIINKKWNISNFSNIAYNRTETLNRDGLYITPHISICGDGEENNGFFYDKYLQLGEQNSVLSTIDNGEIYFNVPGVLGEANETTYIYVAARGSGNLQLVDEFGNLWGEANLNYGLVTTYKFSYSGSSVKLYLRVDDNLGRIYDVFAHTAENNISTIDKNWNISSSLFNNLGYSNELRTVDGLTILSRVNVAPKNTTYNNTNYTHMLSIGGRGIEDDRGVKFDVPGKVKVKIIAKSSSSPRNIILTDMMGYSVYNVSVNNLNEYEFIYNENVPTTLYLRSLDSGFYIYNIKVESID